MQRHLTGRWGKWPLFILGWAALSLLFAPEAYLSFYLRNAAISWQETLQLTVINSAIALIFIPAIIAMTRRFPFERHTWHRAVLAHIPACLAFSVGHSCLYALACHAWHDVGGTLFYRFHPNLLTYWAVVGFTQTFEYLRRDQERDRQVAGLRLELLKAQLHPHFLFNTLHTISAMMHEDVKGADRMISRLSELLRITLANIGKQQVTLAEELDFVHTYLEIERVRFGERLATETEVAPELLEALVPALFLQPLVENCVRHGLSAQQEDGLILIRAVQRDARLVLSISDNGRGFPAGQQLREGLGLSNTRKRLQQLYPQDHTFSIEADTSSGAVVTAEIPFNTARTATQARKELVSDDYQNGNRGRRAVGPDADRYAPQL